MAEKGNGSRGSRPVSSDDELLGILERGANFQPPLVRVRKTGGTIILSSADESARLVVSGASLSFDFAGFNFAVRDDA